MKLAVVATLVAAGALAAAASAQSGAVTFCSATQLAGTFNVVPGSAGAGNVVYKLSVHNTSTKTCALTGTPSVRLYGRTGKALPTHVMPTFRPGLTAILVRLDPGAYSHATARFSPDVTGTGDMTGPQCEPKAYSLHVFGRDKSVLKAPVRPPTPVCERGSLQMSVYMFGR